MEELRATFDVIKVDPAIINEFSVNSLWLITATIMVLFMQAGFLMLEAGNVRSKNTINVAQKNLTDFIVCGCVFLLIGGPIMFGVSSPQFLNLIGLGGYDLTDNQTRLMFMYQFGFCATAATIISGAVSERMSFNGYVLLTICITGLIYPVVGHAVWGNSLIANNPSVLTDMGFLDFAGSSVVHLVGGCAALVAVLVVGARKDRFDANGVVSKLRGHSSVLAIFGTMILMFGWIGFNAGSANPGSELFSQIVLNTIIAMTFGGAAGLLYSAAQSKGKTNPKVTGNGILGGLVCVTAGCAYVDHYSAVFIGFCGGLFAVGLGDFLLHKMKIDDPVDAISVHGGAGILGTLLLAVFAKDEFLTGSRFDQFMIQGLGVLAIIAWTMAATFISLKLIGLFVRLRVNEHEEEIGLNIAEHDDDFDITIVETLIKASQNKTDALTNLGTEEVADNSADQNENLNVFSKIIKGVEKTQERIVEAEGEIQELATTDQLTGLHNRASFKIEVEKKLANPNGALLNYAVLYLDLDGFKAVNDGHGHNVGDLILQNVASRLIEALDKNAVVSRFGGDEFVVFLPLRAGDGVDQLSDRLTYVIDQISEKNKIDNLELYVGASVGVELQSDKVESIDDMIIRADMALYEAKAKGKGQWVMFEEEMADRAVRRSELEIDMRLGMERGEFDVHYQPQADIGGKELVGFEALMRWEHPLHGTISPMEFIPIAEETGLIIQLSEQLTEKACLAAKSWPLVNGRDCRVSVNISPVQFLRSDVYSMLKDVLERTGLPASRLEIEITESVLIQDLEDTKKHLNKIAELGVEIAIDDFGTGYSSLGYLQEFPINRLKVDSCFVRGIEKSVTSQRISKAIVDLGKSMGLEVIAEGVETHGQRTYLENLECDQIQGYLYSPPVSLASTLSIITRANDPSASKFDEELARIHGKGSRSA